MRVHMVYKPPQDTIITMNYLFWLQWHPCHIASIKSEWQQRLAQNIDVNRTIWIKQRAAKARWRLYTENRDCANITCLKFTPISVIRGNFCKNANKLRVSCRIRMNFKCLLSMKSSRFFLLPSLLSNFFIGRFRAKYCCSHVSCNCLSSSIRTSQESFELTARTAKLTRKKKQSENDANGNRGMCSLTHTSLMRPFSEAAIDLLSCCFLVLSVVSSCTQPTSQRHTAYFMPFLFVEYFVVFSFVLRREMYSIMLFRMVLNTLSRRKKTLCAVFSSLIDEITFFVFFVWFLFFLLFLRIISYSWIWLFVRQQPE